VEKIIISRYVWQQDKAMFVDWCNKYAGPMNNEWEYSDQQEYYRKGTINVIALHFKDEKIALLFRMSFSDKLTTITKELVYLEAFHDMSKFEE
jgi:hypothetical protein